MRTKSNAPTVTQKWPIEVPTHTYGSPTAVFKVLFGKKYLIWKGKSLLQSCQQIAESVERMIRLDRNQDETHQFYHLVKHVKSTRVIRATVEVLATYDEDELDGYKILMDEQAALDEAHHEYMCLNNNVQAYVPKWISKKDQDKFLRQYEKTHK